MNWSLATIVYYLHCSSQSWALYKFILFKFKKYIYIYILILLSHTKYQIYHSPPLMKCRGAVKGPIVSILNYRSNGQGYPAMDKHYTQGEVEISLAAQYYKNWIKFWLHEPFGLPWTIVFPLSFFFWPLPFCDSLTVPKWNQICISALHFEGLEKVSGENKKKKTKKCWLTFTSYGYLESQPAKMGWA